MKVICTQENLAKALSYLERVVGKQTTLPILSNFLLETEKGRLKLSATNLEIGVIVVIGAKIEKEGKITVPAKILSNFIHNLPSGDVLELESDNQSLRVMSTTYQMKIKGMDGKDFPIIPQYKKDYFFSFPAQELKNALSRLLFCVSTNEARLELTGVHISFFPQALHIAATDSFRLAEEIIPFTGTGSQYQEFLKNNQSLILPGNVLNEIMRVVTPESTAIQMALEENQLFFEVDGVEIVSRIINGKYPDYKQIIPQSFTTQVIFERESLQRAIKIAGAFSSYTAGEIVLHFSKEQNNCTFVSQSQEVGENKTVLPVDFVMGDGDLVITFNPRYVLEGINALSGEKVLFMANTSSTPAGLRMLDEENHPKEEYLYIMMPIRK